MGTLLLRTFAAAAVLTGAVGGVALALPAGATDTTSPGPAGPPVDAAVAASLAYAQCEPGGATGSDAAIADSVRARMNGRRLGAAVNAYNVSCARAITDTVKSRGLAQRAAVIAVTTAITESELHNYTEAADHDSLGLFQQRPSRGWGTPAQVTDPVYATNAFLNAMLRKFPNNSWMTGDIGSICQAVQVSAVPDAYGYEVHDADLLVSALWGGGVSAVLDGGLVRVFARGADGALWEALFDGQWHWQSIGGQITDGPAVTMDGSIVRVFTRGTDGAVWQAYSDGQWHWQSVGGRIIGVPGAVVSLGSVRVYARGVDGALWEAYFVGQWHWQSIGGQITDGPAATLDGGVVRVFARGTDGAVWQSYFDGDTHWQSIGGGITGVPGAFASGGGVRVFARGSDGAVWEASWDGQQWNWQSIGGRVT
jgi:hypothetical protein